MLVGGSHQGTLVRYSCWHTLDNLLPVGKREGKRLEDQSSTLVTQTTVILGESQECHHLHC